MNRRSLIRNAAALAVLGVPGAKAWANLATDMARKQGHAFSFDTLKQHAKTLAESPYQAYDEQLPKALTQLSPQQFHKIAMPNAKGLWAGQPNTAFEIVFSHVGMHFDTGVKMNVVDPDTSQAHAIPFQPQLFDYAGSGVKPSALQGKALGYAGFDLAIKRAPHDLPRIASFLGASYFRAVSQAMEYGLSARGLAIDIGEPGGEEFPEFVEYWFVRPHPDSQEITVYALLDSPSVTGAYRFDIGWTDQGTVMDVQSELHTRKNIKRLGIAPMSSMFLKGTAQPRARDTIYPRMHDSNQLSMWRGNGEWICRPLYNPKTIQDNQFQDENPRGFGLIQSDHDFADYKDTVVRYDQRPSLWVEPGKGWGKGAVALLEMPTVGETTDNIAAFWVPRDAVTAGETLNYDYTLYWFAEPPHQPSLATVVATHSGMGNVKPGWIPGDSSPEQYARRFAVDFAGDVLSDVDDDADIAANITASSGHINHVHVRHLAPIGQYRAEFDWQPDSDATQAITLRCYLHANDQTLSETWLYQWVPPKPGERHY